MHLLRVLQLHFTIQNRVANYVSRESVTDNMRTLTGEGEKTSFNKTMF
jgi:hypothetical protein